jgi:hypothetical protein
MAPVFVFVPVLVVVVGVVDIDGDGAVEVDPTVDEARSNSATKRPIPSKCSASNVSTSINEPSNS